jgi:putative transposase
VRAKLVREPDRWPWSSYAAHAGLRDPELWLDMLAVWQQLTGGDVTTAAQAQRAAARYRQLVADSIGALLWEVALRQQNYFGDEAFVARMQAHAEPQRKARHPQRACAPGRNGSRPVARATKRWRARIERAVGRWRGWPSSRASRCRMRVG